MQDIFYWVCMYFLYAYFTGSIIDVRQRSIYTSRYKTTLSLNIALTILVWYIRFRTSVAFYVLLEGSNFQELAE